MKKLFTLLSLCIILTFGNQASAQYCGFAHATCDLPKSYYGFGPLDSIACFQQGTATNRLIPFKNYHTFTAQGNTVTIYGLRIDTIANLPCGLCWSTNKPTNEFAPDENGCFLIQGTTTDPPGEYKARLILSVNTTNQGSYNIQHINADAGGIYLYLRVMSNGTVCAAVDTNSLGLHAGCKTNVGINEVTNTVNSLAIQPNPMTNEAKVTFTSEISAEEQVRIINIVGSEVYHSTISANVGLNETTIARNNLPAGIYILSVGNNKGIATRKFIISE